IDDAAVERTGKGKLDGRGKVPMVDRADLLGRMPLSCDRIFGKILNMAIPVTIDEGEAKHCPVEVAFLQFLLGRDFAGRVCLLWIDWIVFPSRVCTPFFIDIAGAGEDESSLRRIPFSGSNEIACPFHIALPNQVGVLGA